VDTGDYSNSGFTRGHMCPSGDRTDTVPDNSATFLMTNFLPQLAANNSGPWEDLEDYCRTLATSGSEVYIISGGNGSQGFIHPGQVNQINIPATTWKVVLVLPNGTDDLRRVDRNALVFAVSMSNSSISSSAPFTNFLAKVSTIERQTGFNFLSNLPRNTQELLERKKCHAFPIKNQTICSTD
jgi:endonuclease G